MDEKRIKDKLPKVRVVGIGASAGGIEAISRVLDCLPNNTGLAFVFIQHLSPVHDSSLPAILTKHTQMPVLQVMDATPVMANQVYVIAPGTVLTLLGEMLIPSRVLIQRHAGSTVDAFLVSLANTQKEESIAVILSGANADGMEGIKAIKAAGGIVYAQTPESAKYDTAPKSVIATSNVDYVLPPEEIGKQLGQLGPTYDSSAALTEDAECWTELMDLLHKASGIDFKNYKDLTVSRRIARRLGITKIASLQEYVKYIKLQPAELTNLERELLINYTRFFRDETVFENIKTKVLPELFRNRLPEDNIRLWIPACSTGEEAYSFAILLTEYMETHKLTNPVQIFGSDADDEAIEQARLGIYPKSINGVVSPTRLNQFFRKTDKGFKLTAEIRGKCVFSRQNLLNDPPFSRVDLISCRNMLIYLGTSLQKQALLRFHYALKPDGYLVLGTSESTNNFADYFEPIAKKLKIYRKKGIVPFAITSLFDPPTFKIRANLIQNGGERMQQKSMLENAIENVVLDRYGPVGVVVDTNMEIVHFRGSTGEFLTPPAGAPSQNLLKMIRQDLSLDLFYALQQAKMTKTFVKTPNIPMINSDSTVSIEVIPLASSSSEESYLLILFDKTVVAAEETVELGYGTSAPPDWEKQREELAATREYMKSVIGQYESSNDNLRTANEEAQTSNEELQTMNEELETAKEELQSTNEELITLNEELLARNEDLRVVNSDIHNVLRSISTSILMLDATMRVRRFNPGAEKLFNLIPTDIGRPISDLRCNLHVTNFQQKVRKAIEDLAIIEEEVMDQDNHWYIMQIRPYRTIDNMIDGAVILFTDITSLRKSLFVSQEAQAIAEAVIATIPDPLLVLDGSFYIKSVNMAFYNTFKVLPAETLNKPLFSIGNGQWGNSALRDELEAILAKDSRVCNYRTELDFPNLGLRTMLINAHRIANTEHPINLILLAIRDITPPS